MALTPFYNDPDFDYQDYWQSRQYENWAEQRALERFFNQIQNSSGPLKEKTLLDVGAGFGRLAKFYLPRIKEALLLEPADKLIKQGQVYLAGFKNFRYQQGDIETLSQFAPSFDIVLLIRVLHHLENLAHVFHLLWQATTPGGFLILEAPNKFNFRQVVRQLFRGHLTYFNNASVDRRSPSRQNNKVIAFWNHSPGKVKKEARAAGWNLQATLSVSNLRHPWLKHHLPSQLLFALENSTQPLLGHMYFGPSIFFLFQKPLS